MPGREIVTLLLNNATHDKVPKAGGSEFGIAATTQESKDAAWEVQSGREADEESESAVQMRGLPYRATAQDILDFLGYHVRSLKDEKSVQLVSNRDGRPSGFAKVQFNSPEAAKAARDELHMQVMEVSGSNSAKIGRAHV